MGDALIEEPFIKALEDSLELLQTYLERSFNPIQLKIVLNSIIRDVTEKVNSFIQDARHTSKEKMDALIESLPLVTNILNVIPDIPELVTNRMELISLSNFLRLNLAAFSGDSSNATVMTSASLLSQLLIGEVPHLKKLPELPGLDEYQSFKDIYFSFFNSVQSTTAVYEVLIDSIDSISRENLVTWINEAFWSTSLMLKHFHNYPLKQILERRKVKNWKVFYSNIFAMIFQVSNIPYLIHEVFKKFQGDWPLEIEPYGLIRSTTIEGLLEGIDNIKSTISRWEDILVDAYRRKLIPINDPVEQQEGYSVFQESLEGLDNLKEEILIFDLKKNKVNLEYLDKFLKSSTDLTDFLVEFAGGMDRVIESFYADQIMSYMSYLMPYASYASVQRGSSIVFEDLLFKYKRIIESLPLESEPTFHFNKILARVYVATHLRESFDFDDAINELERLVELLILKPRMMLMAAVLLVILYSATGNESKVSAIMEDVIETAFFEESQHHIREEFLEYSSLLKSCLMGETVSFTKFSPRLKYMPFDIMSLLIPDFSSWFKDRPVPVYVPFNRIIDSVMDEIHH